MIRENNTLIYNGTDMLNVFSKLTHALDVLYVLEDKKPVARISVNNEEYSKTKMFCKEHMLAIKKSHEKSLKNIKLDDANYASDNIMIDSNIPSLGYNIVYISKFDELAEKARAAEFLDDHEKIGVLLGYPKCCIDYFKKLKKNELAYASDFISTAIEKSVFNVSLINIIPKYVDCSLISHFPCSFDCVNSIKIAEQHLSTIRKYSPELAENMLTLLKSPVIYTKKNGIHILINHSKKNDNIIFKRVISSANNALHESIKNAGVIKTTEKGVVQFD